MRVPRRIQTDCKQWWSKHHLRGLSLGLCKHLRTFNLPQPLHFFADVRRLAKKCNARAEFFRLDILFHRWDETTTNRSVKLYCGDLFSYFLKSNAEQMIGSHFLDSKECMSMHILFFPKCWSLTTHNKNELHLYDSCRPLQETAGRALCATLGTPLRSAPTALEFLISQVETSFSRCSFKLSTTERFLRFHV